MFDSVLNKHAVIGNETTVKRLSLRGAEINLRDLIVFLPIFKKKLK